MYPEEQELWTALHRAKGLAEVGHGKYAIHYLDDQRDKYARAYWDRFNEAPDTFVWAKSEALIWKLAND